MKNIKSRNPAWPGHPPGRQGGDKDPETSQTNRIHWGQCQHIFKQEEAIVPLRHLGSSVLGE